MNFLSKSNLSYDDLVMFYSDVSFAPDKHEQTNSILLKKNSSSGEQWSERLSEECI